MNYFLFREEMIGLIMWSKNIVHWEDRQKHYYSIVFTWELWEWCQSAQTEFDEKQIGMLHLCCLL